MKMPLNQPNKERGSVLLSLVIILPVLGLILAANMSLTASNFRLARTDQLHTHAQLATDAGTDLAISQVNVDPDWAGTAGQVTLHNTGNVRTTYESIVATNGNRKEITTTGRSFSPISSSTPSASVTIKTDLREVSSGSFSIVTGVGGLYMSNSAKILGGDVHVNGEISMSNTAQIGLSTNPVNLSVAHQICPIPANSTYPQLCGSGNGQPITLNNQAHIYGDVKANNQTTTSGMSSPGLTASSGVAALPLPAHDRDAQKAAVSTTIDNSAASCSGSQTRTWAANTKITGDVSVSNNCVVTVEGDVWITGNLNTSNSSLVKVSNALGTTRPNIMIDGSGGATFSNSSKLVSNASSTGFQVITYRSRASCSPDCADVTGTDLYNSRNDVTISLSNSAEGANTVFYARWTRVNINNTGAIGALVGQTVQLSNNGTITFGATVSGAGTSFWVVDGYRRTFN
jgi:hypothetical protein